MFNPVEDFGQIDYSGDGFISLEEFCDYCIKKSLFTMTSNLREAQKILSTHATYADPDIPKKKVFSANKKAVVNNLAPMDKISHIDVNYLFRKEIELNHLKI